MLRTDYLALVDAMSSGNHGRFDVDYKELRVGLVHGEDFQATAERFPAGVTFEHVYGHEGNVGNEKV